jgi:TolA-binding protein
VRARIHNDYWKWIVWLFILILLNAIALGAGRGGRRGDGRPSSDSGRQPDQAQQSSPPAAPQQSPAPVRESRSASRSESRSRPAEVSPSVSPSVSQTSPSRVEVRSSSRPTSRSRAVYSESPSRTVEHSRPVRHEVIVAPSSQSLNVSSPQNTVQASPPSTVERNTQVRHNRTVEVKQIQSDPGSNSASSVSRPARRDRLIETIGITADNTRTTPQPDSRSDSNRQAHGRVERTDGSQSKDRNNKINSWPSVTTVDTAKSQETTVSVSSPSKSEGTKVSNRSDNSRNTRNGTVIRHEGRRSEDRNIEPVVVKTEDIKAQPQKSRLSRTDGQRPDNNDRALKTPSQDRTQTPSVIASKTDNQARTHRNNDSESQGRRSDSRWSKLRSKINDEAGRDMRSRDGRTDRHDRIQSDEHRGRVVVNNNNIHVERGDREDHRRPHVSRHLVSDIGHIRNDHRWNSCGSSFTSHWSDRSCGRIVLAPYHDYYGISYYYPSYHRKYLFVSLGGYWPYSYRYQRYYWYGCHPYYWYGSDVVLSPSPVVYDYTTTYNYYTTPAAVTTTEAAVTTELAEDATATDTPLPQTQADINFANAVNAFEEGRYDNATELFREALLQSPEDEVLPFTYTQALFATGDYALAAYVLRETMAKMPADEPAIYFPRGLYKDDQILVNQIAQLESAIVIEPFSTDYQLLLGYQYLGIAQWDKAVNALEQAARNPLNAGVVTKLLDIAEKMEKDVQPTVTAPQS